MGDTDKTRLLAERKHDKMARRLRPWEPNPETIFEDLMAVVDGRAQRRREAAYRANEAQRTKREARRQAGLARAVERHAAAKVRPPRPAKGQDIASRMLAGMVPGEWYGAQDIAPSREARSKVWQVLWVKGWIERALNPAWSPKRPIVENFAGATEPRWLWRITASGMAHLAALDC